MKITFYFIYFCLHQALEDFKYNFLTPSDLDLSIKYGDNLMILYQDRVDGASEDQHREVLKV